MPLPAPPRPVATSADHLRLAAAQWHLLHVDRERAQLRLAESRAAHADASIAYVAGQRRRDTLRLVLAAAEIVPRRFCAAARAGLDAELQAAEDAVQAGRRRVERSARVLDHVVADCLATGVALHAFEQAYGMTRT